MTVWDGVGHAGWVGCAGCADSQRSTRSRTALGSTATDPPTTDAFDIEDVLTSNATRNPLFSSWTSVYLRYC